MINKISPVKKVRVDSIHGAGIARFWEISCRTVPEIPQLNEAAAAHAIPLVT